MLSIPSMLSFLLHMLSIPSMLSYSISYTYSLFLLCSHTVSLTHTLYSFYALILYLLHILSIHFMLSYCISCAYSLFLLCSHITYILSFYVSFLSIFLKCSLSGACSFCTLYSLHILSIPSMLSYHLHSLFLCKFSLYIPEMFSICCMLPTPYMLSLTLFFISDMHSLFFYMFSILSLYLLNTCKAWRPDGEKSAILILRKNQPVQHTLEI
jgi:hypothetical protein